MKYYAVKRGHSSSEWYVTYESESTTYDYIHTTNREINARRMANRLNKEATQ